MMNHLLFVEETCRSTGCLCEYYDEKMEVKKIAISYKELAKNIALMIEEGRY